MTRDDWIIIDEILATIINDDEIKARIGDELDLIDDAIDFPMIALQGYIAARRYTLSDREKLLRSIRRSHARDG